jgi:Rrf2 family iron-sulfur cluster assembly transcriptional regulator
MRCATHDLWSELSNQIHLFLNSVTLADVVNRRILGTSGRFMGHEGLADAASAATAAE